MYKNLRKIGVRLDFTCTKRKCTGLIMHEIKIFFVGVVKTISTKTKHHKSILKCDTYVQVYEEKLNCF